MSEPTVRFPVKCPQCGDEHLFELPLAMVAIGLFESNKIRLHAPCHGIGWEASALELEQIREYLAASCIDVQRR